MTEIETILINHWPLISLTVAWSIVWTGIGLWRAARLGHRYWFIAMLLLNTVGVLEILYIYYIAKTTEGSVE